MKALLNTLGVILATATLVAFGLCIWTGEDFWFGLGFLTALPAFGAFMAASFQPTKTTGATP